MPLGLSAGINTKRIDVVSVPHAEEFVWVVVRRGAKRESSLRSEFWTSE